MKYTKFALALMLAFSAQPVSAEEKNAVAPEQAAVENQQLEQPQPELTPQQKEFDEAFVEAGKVAVFGPAKIELIDQGTLALPEGYAYIPTKEGARIMNAMGNYTNEEFVGLVTDAEGRMDWFAEIDYIKSGYIKDEEAKDWDVEGMLKELTDATHEANKQRAEQGIGALEVTGWAQKPEYNAADHKLVWSILLSEAGYEGQTINYNTYALGREGYFQLGLVTDNANLAAHKPHADALLKGLNYNTGKSYADFNASTDKVAEYGIAALVGGVAAKKLGLLAIIGVFLLKGWKIILVAVVAFGAIFRKFFKKKTPADQVNDVKSQDPTKK